MCVALFIGLFCFPTTAAKSIRFPLPKLSSVSIDFIIAECEEKKCHWEEGLCITNSGNFSFCVVFASDMIRMVVVNRGVVVLTLTNNKDHHRKDVIPIYQQKGTIIIF